MPQRFQSSVNAICSEKMAGWTCNVRRRSLPVAEEGLGDGIPAASNRAMHRSSVAERCLGAVEPFAHARELSALAGEQEDYRPGTGRARITF